GGHALDLAHVVVEARHDVAERRPRVEARREPLQVAVDVEPHREEDVGRGPGVEKSARDVENEAGGGEAEERADDADGRGAVAAEERAVHEVAGQERNEERERGAREAQEEDGGEAGPVGSNVGGGPAQQRDGHAPLTAPWGTRRAATPRGRRSASAAGGGWRPRRRRSCCPPPRRRAASRSGRP